jgi:hypothetical protein
MNLASDWLANRGAQYVPGGIAAFSLLILAVHFGGRASSQLLALREDNKPPIYNDSEVGKNRLDFSNKMHSHVENHGGRLAFAFELLRAAAALALTGLCMYTTLAQETHKTAGTWVLDASVVRVSLVSVSCR